MLRNDLYKPWFVGEKDWGIEIIDGEFSGVVIQIESFEFSKNDSGGVDLDYHCIKQPEDFNEETLKGDLFKNTLEIIIEDILKEAINHYEQAGSNDTQELGV